MMRPKIGILPVYDEKEQLYTMHPGNMSCIEKAGGVPLMLPLTTDKRELLELARMMDGFLFTGGQDVDPFIYGEFALPQCGRASEKRDEMEKQLLEICIDSDKPCLGICRGLHIFNVMLGGTLYQDLSSQRPSMVSHMQSPPFDVTAHKIRLEGLMAEIMGVPEMEVNSLHHQGIKELSPLLEAVAYSEDGLIEAAAARSGTFCLGVQWSPEYMYEQDDSNLELLKYFVSVCR